MLHAVRHIHHDTVNKYAIRGQYGKGRNGSKRVIGYREEDNISPHSNTETYAALKLFVDNWRWHDVPFYLRTGKRMPRQVSEVTIHFRAVPHKSFPASAIPDWQPSCLVISIQPEEGIVLRFQAKKPGIRLLLKPVTMRFNYQESFSVPVPEAYETLLWDVMNNDATLFMRSDQVNAAWKIIMPVLDFWSERINKVASLFITSHNIFISFRYRHRNKLEDRLPKLNSIVFHEKLGTQGERIERIVRLAKEIAPLVGADVDKARRAAHLAKADLLTEVVGEFPELQGLMGKYYALAQGEDPSVAAASEEHYKPRGRRPRAHRSGGVAVALADKIDTLVGFWAIDEKPTGSKDPYALRRAALGVIQDCRLSDALKLACER